MLPEATAREVGRGLGRAAWALLRKRTHIAISNARRALGTGGARAAERSFQHFGEVIVEMVRAERLYGPKSWQKHVEFGGRANLDRALAMGKGVVCVGAHFGNWEIGGWVMSMLGYRVNAVERPLRNPLVHRELNAFRRATGRQRREERGDAQAIRVLKRGEILACWRTRTRGAAGFRAVSRAAGVEHPPWRPVGKVRGADRDVRRASALRREVPDRVRRAVRGRGDGRSRAGHPGGDGEVHGGAGAAHPKVAGAVALDAPEVEDAAAAVREREWEREWEWKGLTSGDARHPF